MVRRVSPGNRTKRTKPIFRFQFKGLYPALEEAAKLSPALRGRLNQFVDEVECSACGGSRLRDDAAATRYKNRTIDELSRMPLGQLQTVVDGWKLNKREQRIAGELIREIRNRTTFLNDVGLQYLTLARTANSLSGGEAQRIRLASQLGSGLCGVLYVLDEPTIGLHPRDNLRLLGALHRLRDLGNTLVLVEHDRDVIEGSDQIMDFGPAAGKGGGQVVANGTPAAVAKKRGSVTGPYLSGKKAIGVPLNRRVITLPDDASDQITRLPAKKKVAKKGKKATKKPKKSTKKSQVDLAKVAEPAADYNSESPVPTTDWITIRGARHHNLRDIDVQIPLAKFVAVTGPSGSGKSSLVEDVLYSALAAKLHRASTIPGAHDSIDGIENVDKVIRVDQQPLGNSPTSNPATYTGAFQHIRDLFAQLPDSKLRGYGARRFSFNVPGGRCEECEGNGQLCIEMHFLPDVWVPCESCRGARYNADTLEVKFHGHSIADVLNLTCGEAAELFKNIPKIHRIVQTLCDVGLDYLTLGQAAPTLSGGEAQRVKLASELARPDTGQTLYLLDEPTTGLHFNDLEKLLTVLQRLVDLGNTVVVIEHNLDVIKSTDWVIDMGPEAGDGGGQVVVAGTPEQVVDYALANAPSASGRKSKATKKKAAKSTKKKAVQKRVAKRGKQYRSYTGEALAPVLAAGPLVKREVYDPEEVKRIAEQNGVPQMDIAEIGKNAMMPWEKNGRKWHTEDRVGRQGEPAKWDGKILGEFVDRIQDLGEFAETNWKARTVVEITGTKKSAGWFFHAITGETWLLKLKFRVARGTFKRDSLQKRLPLPTLNDLHELPIYSNEPRVKVKNARGPFQEVELRLYNWEETDTPEMWKFLEQAVSAFSGSAKVNSLKPEDMTPWKVLGEKWHYMPKGFMKGTVAWKPTLLKKLCKLIEDTAPGGTFDWTNKVLVHYHVPGQKEPWASLVTKRPKAVELILNGPKGKVATGRVAGLAAESTVDSRHKAKDCVRMQFVKLTDVKKGDLPKFLKEHLSTIAD